MNEFRKVHQFNVFSVNTPMQVGIANYLREENVFQELALFFQEKRDFFRSLLKNTRFKLLPCSGSYFQCVSFAEVSEEPDTEMAKRLVTAFGVASVPVSAFYKKNIDNKILRFCFAKQNDTLEKAVDRLLKV